jgi:hypothetical protein
VAGALQEVAILVDKKLRAVFALRRHYPAAILDAEQARTLSEFRMTKKTATKRQAQNTTKDTAEKSVPRPTSSATLARLRLGSVKEACLYGHISHTKLYDFIHEGKVDAYKRDRNTLIDLDSIDRMNAKMERFKPGNEGGVVTPRREKRSA